MGRNTKVSPEDEYRKLRGLGPEVPVPTSLESPTFPPDEARKLDERRWASREAAAAIRDPNSGARKAGAAVRMGSAPAFSDRDGWAGSLDAGVRAAADAATMGGANHIAAGLNSVIPGDDSVWNTGDIAEAYRRNMAREDAIDVIDEKLHSKARLAGAILGSAAGGGLGFVPLAGKIGKGATAAEQLLMRVGLSPTKSRLAGKAIKVGGEGAAQSTGHGLISGNDGDWSARLQRGVSEGWDGLQGALGAGAIMHGLTRPPQIKKVLNQLPNVLRYGTPALRPLKPVTQSALESFVPKIMDWLRSDQSDPERKAAGNRGSGK